MKKYKISDTNTNFFTMKYKYSSRMNVSLRSFIKRYTKIIINFFLDIFEKDIQTSTLPVFVVGCGNSGTTLLATILSRHPKAFPIGYESSFYFPTFSLSYSKRISIMLDMLSKQNDKTFFIEKTPKHALCIKRIFKILPHSKIIYVIRDGRDAVTSLKKRYGDLAIAVDRWNTDNRPALVWGTDPRVKFVKYENLTSEPEQTVLEICKFLKIQYDEKMLNSAKNPYSHFSEGNMRVRAQQVSKPIYNNAGSWKQYLSAEEIDFFWKKSNILMKYFEYS